MKQDNTHYIYYDKTKDNYIVTIRIKGEKVYIGTYPTVEEARIDRDKALEVIKENDIPKDLKKKRNFIDIIMSFKEE